MTEKEIKAARIFARNDFYFFCRYMYARKTGGEWKKSHHQKQICDALMRVYNGHSKRLIINMPPRYSKTELAVVCFIAWTMGRHADSKYIHTSYTATIAEANARNIRELMQHEEYKAIFPNFKLTKTLVNELGTSAGGEVHSVGEGGGTTGKGAGLKRSGFGGFISIDDPHKAGEVLSNTKRESVSRWFQTTLENRKNSRETPIILTMQRLHVDDLAGFLIGGGNGEKWELLQLSAISDDNEALWADMHTVEELLEMQKFNPYNFAAQYMQKPQLLGGNLIKEEFFKYHENTERIRYRVIFADTAMKTGQQHDYSVMQCWGMGYDNNLYLLDQVRGKFEAYDLETIALEFWEKHKTAQGCGALRSFNVEDKASGTGLIQTLKARHGVPVVAIQRNKDKLNRVNDNLTYIQNGRVRLPLRAGFTSELVAECCAFSVDNSHKHDDQIDPMLDAIETMLHANAIHANSFTPLYF